MRALLAAALLLVGCEACTFETPDHGLACFWRRGPDVDTTSEEHPECRSARVTATTPRTTLSLEPLDPCREHGAQELVVPAGTVVYTYYEPTDFNVGVVHVQPEDCEL